MTPSWSLESAVADEASDGCGRGCRWAAVATVAAEKEEEEEEEEEEGAGGQDTTGWKRSKRFILPPSHLIEGIVTGRIR